MCIRILKKFIVLVAVVVLFSLPLEASAENQRVNLSVCVVQRKNTDTINDFDFSFNAGVVTRLKEKNPIRNRTSLAQRILSGVYDIIKNVV